MLIRCKHYFCEKCALTQFKKSTRCFICNVQTNGVFNPAKEIIKRMQQEEDEKEVSDSESDWVRNKIYSLLWHNLINLSKSLSQYYVSVREIKYCMLCGIALLYGGNRALVNMQISWFTMFQLICRLIANWPSLCFLSPFQHKTMTGFNISSGINKLISLFFTFLKKTLWFFLLWFNFINAPKLIL